MGLEFLRLTWGQKACRFADRLRRDKFLLHSRRRLLPWYRSRRRRTVFRPSRLRRGIPLQARKARVQKPPCSQESFCGTRSGARFCRSCYPSFLKRSIQVSWELLSLRYPPADSSGEMPGDGGESKRSKGDNGFGHRPGFHRLPDSHVEILLYQPEASIIDMRKDECARASGNG